MFNFSTTATNVAGIVHLLYALETEAAAVAHGAMLLSPLGIVCRGGLSALLPIMSKALDAARSFQQAGCWQLVSEALMLVTLIGLQVFVFGAKWLLDKR